MKSMLSIRAGLAALFMLAVSTTAYGQAPQIPVTGTVTSSSGTPLPGVTVRVQGTNVRTVTNASGKYSLAAPTDGVLTFSFVGQRPVQTTVAGRGTIDITMAQIPYLEEVVVTGYTEQRRGDITGGVATVNVESASRPTTARIAGATTIGASSAPALRRRRRRCSWRGICPSPRSPRGSRTPAA